MFYLSGRGSVSGSRKTDGGDEFGWYLEEREIIKEKINENTFHNLRSFRPISDVIRAKPRANGKSLSKPTITIITCNDDDEKSVNYSIQRDFAERENSHNDCTPVEQIELNSLNKETSDDSREIDLDMIENDADRAVFTSSIISSAAGSEYSNESENETLPNESRAICYTPERLVRTQEYRILTPSPRYLTIPRRSDVGIDDAYTHKYRGHRRKIGDLIDAKQFGASHLESLLDPGAPEIRLPVTNRRRSNRARVACHKNVEHDSSDDFLYEPLEIANRESPATFQTPDLVSSRSSYEMVDSSWEERYKIIRRSSQEDTSGIHSSDWSTDPPSGAYTPLCLCDELATVSRSFGNSVESKNRTTAINEVVSILEGLKRDPDRAAELLEDDRFCGFTSGHDHLTRLALAIEPDGYVPTVHGDPDNLVIELREKVERLQEATRNILRDIDVLRQDFECNESKVDDLIEATVTLRRDTTEVRYLDDLLSLLDGELERISRRNWPFVFGHEHPAEEMNLVI